jgi:DNA-binding FadR family transcriptional regulator
VTRFHLAAVRADAALHEALIENSSNSYLVEAYGLVSGRVGALRAHNLTGARDVRGRSVGEHEAIISAYSTGDLQRAEEQLGEHIRRMGDAFRAAKRRRALAKRQTSRRRSLAEIWPQDA